MQATPSSVKVLNCALDGRQSMFYTARKAHLSASQTRRLGGRRATAVDVTRIAKVELHCHLDGIVHPRLLVQHPPMAGRLSAATLNSVLPVGSRSAFRKYFEYVKAIEQPLDGFVPLLRHHVVSLQRDGVLYTEIMVPSSALPATNRELMRQFVALRRGVAELEAGITQVEFIIAIGRHKKPSEFDFVAQRAFRLHRQNLICGVAVAGPDERQSLRPITAILARLRDAGLGIEVHAGEWSGAAAVEDALKYGHPHRLGHALGAFATPRLVEEIVARNIHVEFCLTSNVRTGAIRNIYCHPLVSAISKQVSCSLNTDDPGAFGCSMSTEYQLAQNAFDLNEAQLRKLGTDALGARFQPKLRVPVADRDL